MLRKLKKPWYGTKDLCKGAETRVRVFADIQNFALRAHCVHGIPHEGVCAQRGHSAGTTRTWQEEIGGFCYNWQYSCQYKPYYTPTTLDSLMFAKAGHKNTATKLGTAMIQCHQDRANR